MKSKRGILTLNIKKRSKELLHYAITQTELRLMPYIMFTVQNSKQIDTTKINAKEQEILEKWHEMEYITLIGNVLHITKEFWSAICELVYMGYVDI